jgi:hypothetical protein
VQQHTSWCPKSLTLDCPGEQTEAAL